MICEKCQRQTDGLIGGYEAQAGAAWCVDCVRAAGLNLPTVLAAPYQGDNTNAIREAWLARKAEEKRAKLEAFLASRKSVEHKAAAPEPVRMTAGRIGEQMGFSL